MTAVSQSSAVERIARVLAGVKLSGNAEGQGCSMGEAVDDRWREHLRQAAAVLRTLREPDAAMAEAGDPKVWSAMVEAALREHRTLHGEADG